jgi:hypothetical protein
MRREPLRRAPVQTIRRGCGQGGGVTTTRSAAPTTPFPASADERLSDDLQDVAEQVEFEAANFEKPVFHFIGSRVE